MTFSCAFVLVSLSLAAVLAGACKPQVQPEPAPVSAPLPVIGQAPAWQLKDLDGGVVSSEQFKGKLVLLDFWATWCQPCVEKIPTYIELQRKYGDQGLVIVAASGDEKTPEAMKRFVAQRGINYIVVMSELPVEEAFGGIEFYPTTIVIDRRGQIRHVRNDPEQRPVDDALVRQLLAEEPARS